MAKTTNYKNKEPLEVQAKRCLLNGMTMTDVEKYLSITRDKVRMINGQITPEDKKTFIGKGLYDCVPESMQQQIAELLKKGRTAKAISQVFNLPVRVINAVGEHRIERVLENIKTSEEIPLVESITSNVNDSIVPEIDISDNGSIIESTVVEPPKRRGRKSTVDMEMCELLYNEHISGKTYAALAKEYGMSASNIGHYISRYRNANNIQTVRYVTSGQQKRKNPSSSKASLTDDMVIKIAKMIMSGESNSDISLETGVACYKIADIRAKKTYKHITKDYNFPIRDTNYDYFSGRGLTREEFDKIIELIMARKNNKTISKEVGVATHTIRDIRLKNTFRRFTKNLTFPEQEAVSFDIKRKKRSKNKKQMHADVNESHDPIMTTIAIDNDIESQTAFEVQPELMPTETNEVQPVIEIGTHKYFANIAKAFAADKFSAILVKHGNMLVYGVENSVKAALLRVISLATPDEVSGCDIYIAGENSIEEEIINAVKSLGVETIIAAK